MERVSLADYRIVIDYRQSVTGCVSRQMLTRCVYAIDSYSAESRTHWYFDVRREYSQLTACSADSITVDYRSAFISTGSRDCTVVCGAVSGHLPSLC